MRSFLQEFCTAFVTISLLAISTNALAAEICELEGKSIEFGGHICDPNGCRDDRHKWLFIGDKILQHVFNGRTQRYDDRGPVFILGQTIDEMNHEYGWRRGTVSPQRARDEITAQAERSGQDVITNERFRMHTSTGEILRVSYKKVIRIQTCYSCDVIVEEERYEFRGRSDVFRTTDKWCQFVDG